MNGHLTTKNLSKRSRLKKKKQQLCDRINQCKSLKELEEWEKTFLVPACLEDISNLNQLYLLRHNTCDDLLFSDLDINNIILVGVRFNCGKLDWIWFWKFNDTIKNITNNKYKLITNNENN